ncbi:MAG: Na/Pi cotransporter family protein [Clostridia bacterium]|nr:Na/Pi cotransporter family protein [Clostridia bacterium]
MDIWNILEFIGGICLFLFGMNLMGAYLEKAAGSGLKNSLGKLTGGRFIGFLTGLGVTAIIQSSSATTVMVVGFVNSGLLTLSQAINVIMGANVGTTVTSWILSLSGIDGGAWYVEMLKPTSFTPILALIGILLYMGSKSDKKRDIGVILLGFAVLMFGMDTMSGAVSGLRTDAGFAKILTMFTNPVLGVLAGAALTAIIQSSSASVGILQALSTTGAISVGMSIPIIMGQNIGTCVTALLSSVGTNRNARRASVVHLSFNIIGTVFFLIIFCITKAMFNITVLETGASELSIAVCHTAFNLLCTALLFPCAKLLEKLSLKIIPVTKEELEESRTIAIDERLMGTPAIAIERCRVFTGEMAEHAVSSLKEAMSTLKSGNLTPERAKALRRDESLVDKYEDVLGSYLVKLSTHRLSDKDVHESTKLLHMIGDLERISDHSVNILESAEELAEKNLSFSAEAQKELAVISAAVAEILDLAYDAYVRNDLAVAAKVEPLEQVIDDLKEVLRTNHIKRMQAGNCSIEVGFIWSDLLTNLERVSDHCSNIAGCVIEVEQGSLQLHEYLKDINGRKEYNEMYKAYSAKYAI